jgi:hypothetical protein
LTSENFGIAAVIDSSLLLAGVGVAHDGDAVALATILPASFFIDVSETMNHRAPPFLS